EERRNQSETPYFDLTTQLAALAPPPPEVAQLLAALCHNPEQRGRFFSMLAHGVPVQEFFSPENVQKILGGGQQAATGSYQASCGNERCPSSLSPTRMRRSSCCESARSTCDGRSNPRA